MSQSPYGAGPEPRTNPYSPSQASSEPLAPPTPYRAPTGATAQVEGYVPLRGRAALAACAVFAVTLAETASHAGYFATGTMFWFAWRPVSIVVQIATFAAYAFVPVWTYRAAKNLRAFPRDEIEFGPGWAAGWYFVPLANLFMPQRVMTELWKASDPPLVGATWKAADKTRLVWLWWGAYLLAGVLGPVAAIVQVTSALYTPQLKYDPVPSVGSGIIFFSAEALRFVSAAALTRLMFRIASRQETIAAHLASHR